MSWEVSAGDFLSDHPTKDLERVSNHGDRTEESLNLSLDARPQGRNSVGPHSSQLLSGPLLNCSSARSPYAACGPSKPRCWGSNTTLFGCKHSLSGHLTVSLLAASIHHVNEALSPTLKRRKLKTTATSCHMAPTQACRSIQDGETHVSEPRLHILCPFGYQPPLSQSLVGLELTSKARLSGQRRIILLSPCSRHWG